ncbi:MAG: hypothetical protein ACRCYU_04905 [Nocardioides sp.]
MSLGVAALMLAAGSAWGLSTFWNQDPTAASSSPQREGDQKDPDSSATSGDGDTPPVPDTGVSPDGVVTEAQLTECQDEWASAAKVIAAARKGADHWAGHIGAHADWLAGKISEDEKKERYKATRLAGPADIARYRTAVQKHQLVVGACEALSGSLADIPICERRKQAIDQAMATGQVAIMDWKAHLDNMAAFAEQEFAVDHAQMLWEKSFTGAPAKLAAFTKARSALDKAPPCAWPRT